MHPAFTNIQFGPFTTTYHREAVNEDFKQALSAFLESKLLSQVEQPYDSTSGKLTATFNDQKYCGPRSAVRDIYKFEFTFHRQSGDDMISSQIVFSFATRNFAPRQGHSFYLSTPSSRERQRQIKLSIKEVCNRLASREQTTGNCPLCSASLNVVDSPDLFDVRCPENCFKYNFHRDPTSGEILHGHFFMKESASGA